MKLGMSRAAARVVPKYRAYGRVVGSKYLGEFEAKDEEEAKTKAIESEAASCSLCWQCDEQVSDPEIDECSVELIAEEKHEH